MQKQLLHSHFSTAAVLVAALAAGAIASAPAASRAADSPNDATYVCRPSETGETADARMITSGTTLVCRPVSITLHMTSGALKTIGRVGSTSWGMDYSRALTPDQVNSAYVHFIEQTFQIDHTP